MCWDKCPALVISKFLKVDTDCMMTSWRRLNGSVSSFLHQLTTWHCSKLLLSASRAALDQYLLPAGPTAANPPHPAAAIDRWDRQTDRQTLPHSQWTVKSIKKSVKADYWTHIVFWMSSWSAEEDCLTVHQHYHSQPAHSVTDTIQVSAVTNWPVWL